MTANYIYNRTPIRSTKWRTPYELRYGTAPDVSHFKVFGCKAYYHVPEHNRRKLDPKSKEATFVGYEPNTKKVILYGIDIAGPSSSHEMLYLMKRLSLPALTWAIRDHHSLFHHLPYLLGSLLSTQ